MADDDAEATRIRAALDQARAAADEQERIRKSNEAIKERIRRDGR